MKEIESRRVFVVTGAGRGIGRAICKRLVADGIRVLAIDRNEEDLLETVHSEELMRHLVLDVTTADAPAMAFDEAVEAFGRVDGIVNNAGIGNGKPAHLTSDEEYDHYVNLMLRALFRFSRETVIRIPENGCIVQITSIFGLLGTPSAAAYASAKAGVIGLTRQMAADYGRKGFRINAIAPGVIDTPATHDRITADADFKRRMLDTIPSKRFGSPEDVANAVAFLVSPQSGFVNGHVLVVDGGWSTTNI